jgi:hypothetical protein
MSKLPKVVFSLALMGSLVSLAMGCAEQKGAKKDDKKTDKKAVDTAAKADKQE